VTVDRRKVPSIASVERSRANAMLQLHQRSNATAAQRATLVSPTDAGAGFPPFSLAGAVVDSVSPPWTPLADQTLTSVRCLLGTAGSTSTTVKLRKNGTVSATIVIASSDTDTDVQSASIALTPGDLLTVEVDGAGTGASDLTVVLG
jgi:hypothetical protein